ncbi:MAG: hypothetical protein LBT46_08645, partial [Planctomycetaceae bacterium]|nr:hypothetical protein [Planctomycetaceae bacterium]
MDNGELAGSSGQIITPAASNYQLSIINYQLSIINYQLSIINYQLSIPPAVYLTAFEEYMLLDNHPAYPMSCFVELIFKGRFHLDIFTAAANTAVRLHPLLTSTAEQTPSGSFRWIPHEPVVRISEVPFDPNRHLPAAEGIDLFTEPPLKMTVCRQN